MDFLAKQPLAVGFIPWPRRPSTFTVIVKLTLAIADGAARRTRRQEPLSLHQYDDVGRLVYPSDFTPFKPACDVVMLSRVIPDASLRVAVGTGQIAFAAPVAPTVPASLGERGDPLDPFAPPIWAGAGFNFETLQVVPKAHQRPYPVLPLGVRIRGPERNDNIALFGPVPNAIVLDEVGVSPPTPLDLHCDTVIVDLDDQRCLLVFRGLYEPPGVPAAEPIVAVTLGESPISANVPEMFQWPRAPATQSFALRADLGSGGLSPSIEPDPWEGTQRIPRGAVPDLAADPLPFAAGPLVAEPAPPFADVGRGGTEKIPAGRAKALRAELRAMRERERAAPAGETAYGPAPPLDPVLPFKPVPSRKARETLSSEVPGSLDPVLPFRAPPPAAPARANELDELEQTVDGTMAPDASDLPFRSPNPAHPRPVDSEGLTREIQMPVTSGRSALPFARPGSFSVRWEEENTSTLFGVQVAAGPVLPFVSAGTRFSTPGPSMLGTGADLPPINPPTLTPLDPELELAEPPTENAAVDTASSYRAIWSGEAESVDGPVNLFEGSLRVLRSARRIDRNAEQGMTDAAVELVRDLGGVMSRGALAPRP